MSEPLNTPSSEAYTLLMRRRSVRAREMTGPGPDRTTLEKILAAATRVPDHGKLTPWRFIVLEEDERRKLGDLIVCALLEENASSEKNAEAMRGYATQGPTLVVAVYSPSDRKPIPEWEQQLSMGAACQNMLVAATALGHVGQWLTGWATYSPSVMRGLGLGPRERIAGLLFFGGQDEPPAERDRPDLDDLVTWGFPEKVDA